MNYQGTHARRVFVAVAAVAAISAAWYFLVPVITSDADRNIWNAVVFGVTICIALRWAASH